MYGLTSRESLSKRQSRWVRDVDENVRSNPAQNALNREIPHNPIINKPSLITTMMEQTVPPVRDSLSSRKSNSDEQLELLHNLYDDLKQKYTELKREHESFSHKLSNNSELTKRVDKIEQTVISDVSNRIHQLETEDGNITIRLQHLERSFFTPQNTGDITSLINRVVSLERSLSELSKHSQSDIRISQSSEFSALTEPDMSISDKKPKIKEFVPYFIKEDYASRDNLTKLDGLSFKMVVELLGFYSEIPIIYPFGTDQDLPRFAELILEMSFRDADKVMNGTAYGTFKCGKNNIYTIQLTELYSDGNASGIEKYTLPLTFTCETELIYE